MTTAGVCGEGEYSCVDRHDVYFSKQKEIKKTSQGFHSTEKHNLMKSN
jgi:hypothetical protein